MARYRKRDRKNRIQLAFVLDSILIALEDSFITRLAVFFKRHTNNILKKVNDLPIFKKAISKPDPTDVLQLKTLMQKYYKKIGKETLKQTNKEITEISGKRSAIRIPDINEGLRYRSEQLAIQKLKDFQKQVRQSILDSPGSEKDKKVLIQTVRKASNVFINRNVKIVSRMESVTVANKQRLEAFNKSRIIKGVQFLAILDNRTTPQCRARHNMVLKLTDPLLSNFTPPCHWACRSLLSGVTIYEKLPFTPLEDLKSVPDKEFEKAKKSTKDSKKKDKLSPVPTHPPVPKVLTNAEIKVIVNKEEVDILKRTGNTYEWGTGWSKFGNQVISKKGKKDHVSFTGDETKLIFGSKMFTHNHPNSASFSWADINFAHSLEIEEMRAVSPDSIRGRGVFTIKDAKDLDIKVVKRVYNRIRKQVIAEYSTLVHQGKLKPELFNVTVSDKIWKEVSKVTGMKYSWEALP